MPYFWKDFEEKQDFTEIASVIGAKDVYPSKELVFKAFTLQPKNIRVVILGQDPYFNEGEAMGLAFSVPRDVKIPSSLMHIYENMLMFKHLKEMPTTGDLRLLHHQGVFLLNTALTAT